MFTPLAVLPESGLTTKSVQCAGQRAGTSASVWEQANCCGVLTYVGNVKARRVAGQHLAVKPVRRGWLHPGAPDCMLRGEVYLALFWLRLGVGGVFHRRPHAQRHREGVAHELVVDERLPAAPQYAGDVRYARGGPRGVSCPAPHVQGAVTRTPRTYGTDVCGTVCLHVSTGACHGTPSLRVLPGVLLRLPSCHRLMRAWMHSVRVRAWTRVP